MKRKKLMKRLAQAKASDVSYAAGWDSWKVLNFSDNLVLAAIDDDNLLNGFQIIPLSFIESLEPLKIPFGTIHYIGFRDRYAEGWTRWFQMHPESDLQVEIG